MDEIQTDDQSAFAHVGHPTIPSLQVRRPSRPFVDTGMMSRGVANNAYTITPPETPTGAPREDGLELDDDQALFHNYLRAFYPFDAASTISGSEESLLMTACIKPGDVILVHSVHANGWADGTVLSSGDRGWIPTNYCEPYDHPYLRNLLNAMTQFWDLLGASEDANLSTFVRQDYIRGLIAGVRHLLEHANCLHRDAEFVQRHTGVRRMRKGLLADLSTLVQIAKKLQDTISEPFAGEVIHVLLDELITKAFKVVTRAVGFADIWTQETAEEKDRPGLSRSSRTSVDNSKLALDTSQLGSGSVTPIDSAICFSVSSNAGANAIPRAAEEIEEAQLKPRPLSAAFRPRKGSVAHRMSLIEKGPTPGALASVQLAKVHDLCISHIGAFIGHHLHSRASSELVETTARLVDACKSMLAIIDEVYAHDPRKSMSIQQARVDLQARLEELIRSTKDMFQSTASDEEDAIVLPEQSSLLVKVGTGLIRTAGDCVVKTRSVIEQIGDFELDHTQAPSPDITSPDCDPPQAVHSERRHSRQLSTMEGARDNRISLKMFPPPPPLRSRPTLTTETADFAALSPGGIADMNTPITPFSAASRKSLPALPQRQSTLRVSQIETTNTGGLKTPSVVQVHTVRPARKDSVGVSIAGSTDTINSSARDSGVTAVSEVSTRATTPDQAKESQFVDSALLTSFASLSSLQSGVAEVDTEAETQLLQRTYGSELTLNKEGNVSGGSLPALVEQLTPHDAAPESQFVSAFYVTFRTFTTPRDLAQALIDRFDYIGESATVGMPVRLRIYNAFKGWLETYWNAEADKDALGEIRYFAVHKLKPHLPSAGVRLIELTKKVSQAYQTGATVAPLVSGVGKSSMSIASHPGDGSNIPASVITPKQLNLLRAAAAGASPCTILDFEPLELARQLTLVASQIFCGIHSEELLGLEWNKKGSQKSSNVRTICSLNTDLAHVVGDTILGPEDAKRRAQMIKHWAKIAVCCLELNNYESLMAIMCSLNSSVVQRLKRTWEVVSKNTKGRLEELNAVVDHSKNHASLRRRLETPIAPCLPFLGIYLTDLTFVDAGNPKTRELPGSASSETGEVVTVINFDRHMRTAKIISHVQKFQVPYKLAPVPELQAWIELQMKQMRCSNGEMVTKFHRRSLIVEPKMEPSAYRQTRASSTSRSSSNLAGLSTSSRSSSSAGLEDVERPKTSGGALSEEGSNKEKFAFLRTNTFGFKTHTAAHDVHTLEAVPEQEK